MRDIKFRAWDVKNKRMYRVLEMYFDNPNAIMVATVEDPMFHLVEGKGCVLLQYTGFKDKNGNEIYEGDMVDYGGRGVKQDIGQVKFGPLKVQWPGEGTYYPKLWYVAFTGRLGSASLPLEGGGEIIGTIYENPELVEGQ